MIIVRSLAELDHMIEKCTEAERQSDDAMRRVFDTFSMATPSDMPADPFSDEYRIRQMKLYSDISGKSYDTSNEVTKFNIDSAVRSPFPYYTRSSTTVGEHISALGFIIRHMGLAPGKRVLEFGPGWGNTTIALARMGYDVTAVDIEADFCELIRRRAAQEGCHVNVIQGEFLLAERMDEKFDAVLFYECFHHCDDHLRLLRGLHHTLNPGGVVAFAGEPITPDFPAPWGVRLDGCSLWAIRKNGWLELGFNETYFREALQRTGWIATTVRSADVPWLSMWRASRASEFSKRYDASSPAVLTAVGQRDADGIRLSGVRGVALYGPYVDLPAGSYVARVAFAGDALSGRALMDVSCDAGANILTSRQIASARDAEIRFSSKNDLSKVEIRLFAEGEFRAHITEVTIERNREI
jgi:2-polyprenyl-3-methyl-5-hydroxy-6-metoxy-1,4-benzoquinol methylase